MRERVPHAEEEQQLAPPPAQPAHAEPPAAVALQLQRTAGNRATAQMVQRLSIMDVFAPGLEIGFKWVVWNRFVRANRESATYFAVPAEWRRLAGLYSMSDEGKTDGAWIRAGIRRLPDFWLDGWIIDQVDSATHAITLNDDVFINTSADGEPDVDTYVHELVHVAQYGILGVTGFLGSYATEFVEGWMESDFDAGEAYHQIAHEQQASAIEERFKAWRIKFQAKEAEEAAQKPKPLDPIKEAEEAMKPRSPITEAGVFPLVGSVGAKGENRPEDVARVAGRLTGLGFLDAFTTDIEKVTEAIERYQSEVLGWPGPDGRVDVDNKTHRALKAGRKTRSMALP